MKRSTFASPWLMLGLIVGIAACDSDDNGGTTEPPTTYDLTFTGDDTFQGAHGGQTIHVGVRGADGGLVASETGTVSADDNPSFSFTFTDVLEEGEDYDLEYWIDSNFGDGGTVGTCDEPSVDHQWRIEISAVSGDQTVDDEHRAGDIEDVCGDGPGY